MIALICEVVFTAHKILVRAKAVVHISAFRVIPCTVYFIPVSVHLHQIPGMVHLFAGKTNRWDAQFVGNTGERFCVAVADRHTIHKHAVGRINRTVGITSPVVNLHVILGRGHNLIVEQHDLFQVSFPLLYASLDAPDKFVHLGAVLFGVVRQDQACDRVFAFIKGILYSIFDLVATGQRAGLTGECLDLVECNPQIVNVYHLLSRCDGFCHAVAQFGVIGIRLGVGRRHADAALAGQLAAGFQLLFKAFPSAGERHILQFRCFLVLCRGHLGYIDP